MTKITDVTQDYLDLAGALDKVQKELKETIAVIDKMRKSTSSQNTTFTEAKKKTEKITKATEQLSDLEKERIRVVKSLSKISAKNATLSEKNTKNELRAKIRLREEHNRLNQEIKEEEGLNTKRTSLTQKLVGAYVAVRGAIMAMNGAMKLAKNAIDSTQKSGDSFAITVAGMKATYDAFNKSIASGDLKNVFKNMKEAFKAGKEYAAVLDDLGDRERDLAVFRAESKTQIENLTNSVQNVTLVEMDRINAAKEIFKIEKSLLSQTKSVREQDFKAQQKLVSALTGMDEERILSFIKNYDEEKELRETALKLRQLESDKDQDFKNQDLENFKKSKVALEDFTASLTDLEKEYIKTFEGYSKTTDEELNKVVASYVALQEAESSSVAGLRRIRNQYNTLMKSITSSNVVNEQLANAEKIDEASKALTERQLKRADEIIKAEIKKSEALTNTLDSDLEAMSDALDAEADLELTKLEERLDREEELKIEHENEELERLQEWEDAKTEIKLAALEAAGQILSDQLTASIDNDLETFLADQDAKEDILKNRLDKGEISEKEYETEVNKIKAESRLEQAKADRKKAIFDSIINTAVGIVKTIANMGFPAAIPAIIVTAALGALQIGTILAQPLPTLKEGTKDWQGGMVEYGEAGRELVFPAGGTPFIANESTISPLPKHSKVLSNPETEAYLSGGMSEAKMNELIKVTKANKNQVVNSTTISDRGMKKITKINNSYIKWHKEYVRG